MPFILRLLEYTVLGTVTAVLIFAVALFVVFLFNRGLQLFFRLFGYEVGDFFGWLMKKLHIKKIQKTEETKEDEFSLRKWWSN